MRKPLTPEQKIKFNEYKKQWRLKNSEKIKEQKKIHDRTYREKNKEKISEIKKLNYKKNKEKISNRSKVYYENNKEQIKNNVIEYRNENKYKINQYRKNRYNCNELFRLSKNIRVLISKSLQLKGIKKNSRTSVILGCTFEEFKLHLENQFEPWMNWDNYGNPKDGIFEPNKTWDIDHIIPSSSATNEKTLIELNHYKNLKPLCSYFNRFIKRGKL